MADKGFYFSLRWKLTILFGSVFLILHSVFSYFLYLKATDNFALDRATIRSSHIGIARTITEDSFSVLEQVAELLSLGSLSPVQEATVPQSVLPTLDDNWSQWQLSWGMENVALFDKQAKLVKSWGKQLISADTTVEQVLQDETPRHQLFCPDSCFQQVIVPVMRESATTGALSAIRSFADVIIKYKHATNADIGVLVATGAANRQWPLQLAGMSLLEKNRPVYEHIASHYSFDELLAHSKTVILGQRVFEIGVFPIQQASHTAPFFLLVDDITADYQQLRQDLRQVWLFGFISLLISLLLLILVLHLALRRVTALSNALPLLSRNQYDQFKKQVTLKKIFTLGYDELDQLNHTALNLSDQLEHLEQEVRNNTLRLMEKSQVLAQQRDFVRRLFEVAPIIMMTQKLNGMILTINQAGIDALESDSRSISGKVFDIFLPDGDAEHIAKLNQLRAGARFDRFQIDGQLLTESGRLRDIAWLHTRLQTNSMMHHGDIILTLGVDISERKAAEEQILKMAMFDCLTGLSNRRKFHQAFTETLALAQRYDEQVALFYMDLDQFKAVNDVCGHESGDKLLVQVAKALQEAMRTTDTLCRIGGDEFTLIMPHAESGGIERIARKINEILRAIQFVCADKKFKISASIGIAIFPQHGLTVNDLLVNADLAMYRAKALGGARHHMFSPTGDYQFKLNEMLYWREMLEDAIANDKFVLRYQPILHIKTQTISHYECLLRLQQDDGQLMMPGDFIGRAEELGFIGQIDRLVLKKAVAKLVELKQQGKDCKLTVNLSGCSFNDTTIFEDISRLVCVPDMDPGRLIFEITETAAVSNFAAAEKLIDQIKALGCSLALDDFGVGFSSFYYLRNFPVDYVKIDGSFIRQIDKSKDDRVFVKALSEVAQAFGKKTVAEFVENEAILSTLKEFGIDYAQGYHIGKPQSLD